MTKKRITTSTVDHVAKLAHIPISKIESEDLANAFSETLDVVDELTKLDISNTETTHQVTGLKNIWREDNIEDSRTFTQDQALKNAKTQHNGFFVVPMLLENKDA
jgi:aspartyl-tRNA(Asn)/glutamyl-tRNA(Gln) amidotransferase subunit C